MGRLLRMNGQQDHRCRQRYSHLRCNASYPTTGPVRQERRNHEARLRWQARLSISPLPLLMTDLGYHIHSDALPSHFQLVRPLLTVPLARSRLCRRFKFCRPLSRWRASIVLSFGRRCSLQCVGSC
jgi:hypothetical protein